MSTSRLVAGIACAACVAIAFGAYAVVEANVHHSGGVGAGLLAALVPGALALTILVEQILDINKA
ncbi:hypothetical protein HNO53_13050 [Billgrantia antri]|uniref:Uncharacterized protein n=1 Tax=Halomonas sulfidivorans TaxID=2733488 RepID=A0ABX7WK95_9GAMM|nr:hypothetical protein [Halomonas sulfidivorans]QTP59563.1 hypothetical protein HNO53_13050 [Halomonas sulfidivorans]